MGAEVAGVEKALALDLDQQHVRVESRVVRQIGRGPERAQREGLASGTCRAQAEFGLAPRSLPETSQTPQAHE